MRRFNAAFAAALAVVPSRAPTNIGVQQATGLRRRALNVNAILEKLYRDAERDQHVHNAHVTADSEARPSIREEVLAQFPPKARKLAR